MASFNDKLIKDLLPPNSLKSDKTNQRIIDEMSSQIITLNYAKIQKWLAVGFLYRTDEDIKFQVLDVNVFEKVTIKLIKGYIDNVASTIKNDYKYSKRKRPP